MNYTANGSNNKQGKQFWGSLHVRDMIVRSSGVLRTIISYIIQHVWLEICSKSIIKWKELPYMPFVPRICIYIYLCKYTRLCFVFTKLLETTENILSMWSFPESQWELWVMLHSPSVMILITAVQRLLFWLFSFISPCYQNELSTHYTAGEEVETPVKLCNDLVALYFWVHPLHTVCGGSSCTSQRRARHPQG